MVQERTAAGVLTVSDKGARGEREDQSGRIVARMLEEAGFAVRNIEVIPDDRDRIAETIRRWADEDALALIITSGGTGLTPRDVTPQATRDVIDYQVPGMAEAMRAESLKKTPHAMISRAVAGVRGKTLIINVPGSPRGAAENLAVVLPALDHALSKLAGDPTDCAT
ncbi:MAG: MogA/MoaB family molybdenum cofactor biosynthesis protein [Deltaproteobacteria bacterium]|nr:MogA/MoaB family molybdenum cofactor biosynthesis protein [Deltaproteobacteria bacterium]MBW1925106.1 MogA/MoaB family molybdenum cofactor biosynthesis protein [Deltaproteobacteria bacterium]MBW1950379.1 MogA/MoaB family molybdenum cofactor biosynthesis protein [Deltaproteobacteria bacterium]MBW2008219.1 MogA/MoaB family molybdenum cofactor biosynthesis protein [Deltaproteobacteria bacterium]MBW2101701.1 MogA/MoaB family molybdenum cofactor biosynthesis protein [Deltaproteobacteria bacterium